MIRVKIGASPYQATAYEVQEDSTPLSAGDSTGSVGIITLGIPAPDPNNPVLVAETVHEDFRSGSPLNFFNQSGPGQWSYEETDGNRHVQLKSGAGYSRGYALLNPKLWSRQTGFIVSGRVRFGTDSIQQAGLLLFSDGSTGAAVILDTRGSGTSTGATATLQFRPNASSTTGATGVSPFSVERGVWYTLSAEVSGSQIKISVSNEREEALISGFTANIGTPPPGVVGFAGYTQTSPVSFDDLRVSSLTPTLSDLARFGPESLLDLPVTLSDDNRGYTIGKVTGVSFNYDTNLYDVDCRTSLGRLMAYNVQAQPYTGTLEGYIQYCLSLAGIEEGFIVDDDVRSRQVAFQGWFGDLWTNLKEMAVSQRIDISLVSGVIFVRGIRKRTAISGRDISRTRNLGTPSLAQSIEIYYYNNSPITNEIVFPVPGTLDPEVFNVAAGDSSTYVIELNASLSSVNSTSATVSPSTYEIVDDRGKTISRSNWEANGGRVNLWVNQDTTSVTLEIISPPSGFGKNRTFSLGRQNKEDETISALWIRGSGVSFTKTLLKIPTGVPASEAPSEVGTSIDSPFISTPNEAYRAGVDAARQYAGVVPAISGTLSAINPRSDSGSLAIVSYGQVQASLKQELGDSATYAQVKDYYLSKNLRTYVQVQQYWADQFRDQDIDQVFGNVQGTRVWDESSRRWYRIRQAQVTPDDIRFDADDDLTHGDMQELFSGMTHAQVQSRYNGFTYEKVKRVGMFRG